MRRISIVLLALISFATIAWAQNPAPVISGVVSGALTPSVNDVVARMLSFDSNRDGKVTVSELPERMQALVARGDTSGDGTLDNAEIATLAKAPAQDARISPGGYTFGDQVGLSSRAHVEGAIEDLRLPRATKEQALDAARWFMDGLETDATADLLNDVKPFLTTEQLTAFRAVVAKGGAAVGNFTLVSGAPNGAPRTFAVQAGLEAHVARLSIPPEQRLKAIAAIAHFRSRLRPGNEERAALTETMKGILSDEERDNLRAALERRPLVKSGMPAVFSGVVRIEAVVDPRR